MDKQHLDVLIASTEPEHERLEFKAGGALLETTQEKGRKSRREEITKDVSALANAAGGRIIYGIKENSSTGKKEYAPIDLAQTPSCTRDWLAQVISTIQPAIDGIEILPVEIDKTGPQLCYVVNIPVGRTAHQAADKRYYRRRAAITEPMSDYEVREVMNRRQMPDVAANVEVVLDDRVMGSAFRCVVRLLNESPVFVVHYAVRLEVPCAVRLNSGFGAEKMPSPFSLSCEGCNVVDSSEGRYLAMILPGLAGIPLFPGLEIKLQSPPLLIHHGLMRDVERSTQRVRLTIYADGMPAKLVEKSWASSLRGSG